MTANTERITLQAASIYVSSQLQIRHSLNHDQVDTYRNNYLNGIDMPPIEIARLGERYWVVDGFHRLAAMKRISPSYEVDCILLKGLSRDAIRWRAVEANMKHGLALTQDERRGGFNVFVGQRMNRKTSRRKPLRECGPEDFMSYSELGKLFGISSKTAQRWMWELYPRTARAQGRKANNPNTEQNQTRGLRDLSINTPEQQVEEALIMFGTALNNIGQEKDRKEAFQGIVETYQKWLHRMQEDYSYLPEIADF